MDTPLPPRSPGWKWSTRLVAAVLLLGFVALIINRFSNLLAPLVLALMFSYILNPPVLALARWTRLPRGLVVVLVYLLLILALLGLATGLGVVIGQQVVGLAAGIRAFAVTLPARLAELSQSSFQIGPFTLDLSRVDFSPVLQQLTNAIQPAISQTGALIGSVASAMASFVGLFLLVLVLGYYMLADLPEFGGVLAGLAPPAYRADIEHLGRATGRVWSAFLRGQLVLGLVVGSVVTVLSTAMGLRYPLALGLLAAFTEFIPIFGPLLSGAAGVTVALVQGNNWMGLTPLWFALAVAAMYILVQQVENNVLVPRIIGRSLNLHPLAVLVGAVAGGSLAGVLGLLLAAPTLATLRLWGGYLYRKILDLEPFPAPPAPPAPAPAPRPGLLARLRRRKPPAR